MNLVVLWWIGCVLVIVEGGFTTTSQGPKPKWNATYTDRLRQDLLLNYDKFARPAQHYNSTRVEFGITATHFDINEMKSTLTLHCYVRLSWQDDKLMWNTSDYGNLSSVHLGDHEIWQPDIFAYNSATAQPINTYGNTPVIVYGNGNVLWVPPAQFTVLCEINLKYWPFDTQTCDIVFGSWTYHGGEIDLQLYDPPQLDNKQILKHYEWQYIGSSENREDKKYDCCAETYPSITYKIALRRVSPSYKAIIVSPAFAILFLILMSFWLPPQAGEKIILQGCTAIIIVMYLMYFSEKLPAMGTNTPLIVLFYSHILFIVALVLIESVAVIWLARTLHNQPLPWKVKQLLVGTLGKGLGLGHYVARSNIKHRANVEELREHQGNSDTDDRDQHILDDNHHIIDTKSSQTSQHDWVLLAAAIDRISFYFYTVLFAVMVASYSL